MRDGAQRRINHENPAVVVSHFPPTFRTGNPNFPVDEFTPYFHNDLEYLMGGAVPVWIFGHHHWSADAVIETDAGDSGCQ